jgi:hypothetical protein
LNPYEVDVSFDTMEVNSQKCAIEDAEKSLPAEFYALGEACKLLRAGVI